MQDLHHQKKWLSILVLRCIGCTQEETGHILKCRKETVVDAEEWLKTCPPHDAIVFCDDLAIESQVRREFPKFDVILPEQLVKAGQVTGDDILRHYRRDYSEIKPKQENRQKLLALIGRWRGEVHFLSVEQLLRRFYLENRRTELEHMVSTPKEVGETYLDVVARHWETIPRPHKVTLPVGSSVFYKRLKHSRPDDEVWQAQMLWDQSCGAFLDAFASWFALAHITDLAMGAMPQEGLGGYVDGETANAHQLAEETKRGNPDVWLFCRLLTLAIACDLLVLGVQQQAPNAIWALEMAKIGVLRADVVNTSMRELPSDFWLTGTNRPYAIAQWLWAKDELVVKQKTSALLEALEKLQIAQNKVHDKLNVLEYGLSG